MKPALVMLLLVAAMPAGAQDFAPFEGRWRGEGALVLGDEPPQRLRCQIRLRATREDQAAFSGRCATAQGAQGFVYLLSAPEPGLVVAENRSEGPDDLPPRMQGRIDAGALRFEAEGGALFELRRDGAALHFVIAGHDSRGPARGEARLAPHE